MKPDHRQVPTWLQTAVLLAFIPTVALLSSPGMGRPSENAFLIDNSFYASFPAAPSFTGEVNIEGARIRSYSYTDNATLLVFTATHIKFPSEFRGSDIQRLISDDVIDQANVVSGKVSSIKRGLVAGHPGAVFVISFQANGLPVQKYGALFYARDTSFQWSVAEFVGRSTASAKGAFEAGLGRFRTK